MDIQSKNQTPKNNRRLWLPVLATMLVIIAVWAIWLFPEASREAGKQQNSFSAFKEKISSSLRLFKKDSQEAARESQEPDIDALRARVFGDQIVK